MITIAKPISPKVLETEIEQLDQDAIQDGWSQTVPLPPATIAKAIVDVSDPNAEASEDPLGADEALREPKGPFANPNYKSRPDAELAPSGGAAEQERVYRPDNQAKIEDYRAQGSTKVAGMTRVADGLVSRAGFRKIMPDSDSDELDVELLRELAERVLRGLPATIFRRYALDPHDGKPRVTYADLAAQYGIEEPEVIRIIGKAHMSIARALERWQSGGAERPEPVIASKRSRVTVEQAERRNREFLKMNKDVPDAHLLMPYHIRRID